MTRLIDADVLKADLKQYFTEGTLAGISAVLAFSQILRDIDNAPTVDAIPNEEGYEMYNKGYMSGYEMGKKERPQGEIIRCRNCRYQIKEFRSDKREKGGGHYVYACKRFGEMFGYWGWGGEDNEFCSDAEKRGDSE